MCGEQCVCKCVALSTHGYDIIKPPIGGGLTIVVLRACVSFSYLVVETSRHFFSFRVCVCAFCDFVCVC